MSNMRQVTKAQFDEAVNYIKGARNYRGQPRHNLDGDAHYVSRNGKDVCVAEEIDDDFGDSDPAYYVEEELYDKHFGYEV